MKISETLGSRVGQFNPVASLPRGREFESQLGRISARGLKKSPRCAHRKVWPSRAWARVREFSAAGRSQSRFLLMKNGGVRSTPGHIFFYPQIGSRIYTGAGSKFIITLLFFCCKFLFLFFLCGREIQDETIFSWCAFGGRSELATYMGPKWSSSCCFNNGWHATLCALQDKESQPCGFVG